MKYYVYILYNAKHDKFYIGQTYNLDKRNFEHNIGISNYTSRYDGEWKQVYHEIFDSRSGAMKREKFLKKQKNKSFYKIFCNM